MSIARCVAWQNVPEKAKAQIRNTFVHWKYDPTSVTFEEWASKHAFYIKKNGQLATIPKHCESVYMAGE